MARSPAKPYDRLMNEHQTASLRYLPMPEAIANEARATLRDRFGHELCVVREYGPCRVCLRISPSEEDYILLSYQPMPDRGPYSEIGPVFVHAHACRPYQRTGEFPADFASRRLVLRAYDSHGSIVSATVAQPGTVPETAATLFAEGRAAEVHVRHESYTCFAFRIVKEEPAP